MKFGKYQQLLIKLFTEDPPMMIKLMMPKNNSGVFTTFSPEKMLPLKTPSTTSTLNGNVLRSQDRLNSKSPNQKCMKPNNLSKTSIKL